MHKIWVWRCEAWVFLPTCWFFCNSSKTVKVVNLVFCSTDWLFTRDIHAKFEIPNSPQSPDITAQKMKFSIKDFFSKYDVICRKLRIWSHLLKKSLTLFRMGFFRAAHGWGGAKKAPLSKICHAYSTMMKLCTVIPYLKKFQKLYESPDTPCVLLTLAFFYRKSANFAISRNTDIYSI